MFRDAPSKVWVQREHDKAPAALFNETGEPEAEEEAPLGSSTHVAVVEFEDPIPTSSALKGYQGWPEDVTVFGENGDVAGVEGDPA